MVSGGVCQHRRMLHRRMDYMDGFRDGLSPGGYRDMEVELSRMAALVETQLAGSIDAFGRRDVAGAEALIAGDRRIDALYHEIDARVIAFLERGNLSRHVLREVMTVMKVAGDLERVGDLATNVAKRTCVVSHEHVAPKSVTAIMRMGRASLRQFSDILNAYNTRNLDAARAVWGADNELDTLYSSIFQDTIQLMMQDPKLINGCTHMAFIAKNFERVGDHATNIAEAVCFLVTGMPVVEPRPKADATSMLVVPSPAGPGGT